MNKICNKQIHVYAHKCHLLFHLEITKHIRLEQNINNKDIVKFMTIVISNLQELGQVSIDSYKFIISIMQFSIREQQSYENLSSSKDHRSKKERFRGKNFHLCIYKVDLW